jgi:hypothetical protein
MGTTIQSCSCIKNGEEEQTEFKPKITNNNITKLTTPIPNENLCPTQNTLSTGRSFNNKDKTFTFSQKKVSQRLIGAEIIQRVIRAFLYRKKFNDEKGLKAKLYNDNIEIIKSKDSEFIAEKLLDTDRMVKKDLNDDFLLKLETKETKEKTKQKPNDYKLKTDCLITKMNGEPCLYKGELNINGKFNGYGELYLKSGKKYEGKFENGKLNGYGRLIDLFGIICYEGTFKDNQLLDGKGKIIKIGENGERTIYEGDIKNMKKEGKGIEKSKAFTYLGSFNDDVKHGKGKIIYEGGDSYEGDFLNGKLTGYGKYKWEDNNTYEGEFLDGNMHGKGLYKWADGNEYEGQYVNNSKEGAGEFRWKNGKIYKGPFKDNKPHGVGLMTKANGETVEVEYVNGKVAKQTETIQKPQKSYTLQNIE